MVKECISIGRSNAIQCPKGKVSKGVILLQSGKIALLFSVNGLAMCKEISGCLFFYNLILDLSYKNIKIGCESKT